jgi:hypothetical protein
MTLDDRHPYSALFSCGAGTGVEDDRREDLRRNAIALSDKSQKIYDTIITAHGDNRIKHAPTSWGKPADDTLLVFNVADTIEVILDELADDLAALGDGGVIGALRNQRDNAKAERERQTSSEQQIEATARLDTAGVTNGRQTDDRASDGSDDLRSASNQQIHDAITRVYDEEERNGRKPPNIRELPEQVEKELRKTGHEASGNRIMRLGEAEQHIKRRRKPGKTLASEKRKADFTK